MRSQRATTIKVGFLIVASVLLLAVLLMWLRGRSFMSGDTFHVEFKDVDGLREGAPVQMMGIRIGFVDDMETQDEDGIYNVKVSFSISDPDVKLPKGSQLSIQQSGLIGEKFLEITPPQRQKIVVDPPRLPVGIDATLVPPVKEGIPVLLKFQEGWYRVGRVEYVYGYDMLASGQTAPRKHFKLFYRIIMPGAEIPKYPRFELVYNALHGEYALQISARDGKLANRPDPTAFFTVMDPVRFKDFLDIQLASAQSLRVTNEKINQLLSTETINTLNSTVDNVEVLTARAAKVLDSADRLLMSIDDDLEKLVSVSDSLSGNINVLTGNLNDIVGDPKFKTDVISAVDAVEEATVSLNKLLNDPDLKATLALTRGTAKDVSELTAMFRKVSEEKQLPNRIDTTLTLLNDSLIKLNGALTQFDKATEDESIKTIVNDTQQTAKNLKSFSSKLKGHFLLWRLLF